VRNPIPCHSEEPKATRNLAVPQKTRRARFLHFVQDRPFAEFTLSGRAGILRSAQNDKRRAEDDSEGLGMTGRASREGGRDRSPDCPPATYQLYFQPPPNAL